MKINGLLLILIFTVSFNFIKKAESNQSESNQVEDEEFTFSHVLFEGYWYSRYNLGHLLMRSGMGETFKPNPEMVQTMLDMASDTASKAVAPKNPALIKRIYNSGSPHFVNMSNGIKNDFNNYRWGESTDTKTTAEAFAWTLYKEIEWTKQFNIDSHFGEPGVEPSIPAAQQRFAGLVLCAEAIMQTNEFMNNPEAFDNSKTSGQYTALGAISNLVEYLKTTINGLNFSENRCAKVAGMMMKKSSTELVEHYLNFIDKYYLSLEQPSMTVKDISLSIQALVWYLSASDTHKSDVTAKLNSYGSQLLNRVAQGITENAYSIRGLIEMYRITKDMSYLTGAKQELQVLVNNFDKKLGIFKNKLTYKTQDVAAIMGAFNSLRLFGGEHIDQEELTAMFTQFFETVVNKSGLQISAPPVTAIALFERLPDSLLHRYSSIPTPPKAGGEYGVAPVFAASVTYNMESGKWSANHELFDTAGAMHLANEMIWFHHNEVSGFPEVAIKKENAPTFMQIQSEVLNKKCIRCHRGELAPHGLELVEGKSYNNLVNIMSVEGEFISEDGIKRVSPGEDDPMQSYIVAKIISDPQFRRGARMPFGGKLNDNQIQMIKDWIKAGALNN